MATTMVDSLLMADLHVTRRQNAVPIAGQHREKEREKKKKNHFLLHPIS